MGAVAQSHNLHRASCKNNESGLQWYWRLRVQKMHQKWNDCEIINCQGLVWCSHHEENIQLNFNPISLPFSLQLIRNHWPLMKSIIKVAQQTAPCIAVAWTVHYPAHWQRKFCRKRSHRSVPFRKSECSRTRDTLLFGKKRFFFFSFFDRNFKLVRIEDRFCTFHLVVPLVGGRFYAITISEQRKAIKAHTFQFEAIKWEKGEEIKTRWPAHGV